MPLSPYSIDPTAPLGPIAMRGLDSPQADMSSLDAAAAFMKAHPEFAKAGPAGDGTTAGQGDPNAPTGGPVTPPFLDRVGAAARQGPPQLSAEMVRSAINSARHAGGASDSPDTLLPSIAGVAPYFAAAPAMMGFHAGQAATDMDENPGRLAPDAISLALASLPAAAGTKVGGAVMDALQSPAARQTAVLGGGAGAVGAIAADASDAKTKAKAVAAKIMGDAPAGGAPPPQATAAPAAGPFADDAVLNSLRSQIADAQRTATANVAGVNPESAEKVRAAAGTRLDQLNGQLRDRIEALQAQNEPFAEAHPNLNMGIQTAGMALPAVVGVGRGLRSAALERADTGAWGDALDAANTARAAGNYGDAASSEAIAKAFLDKYNGADQTMMGRLGSAGSDALKAGLIAGVPFEARNIPTAIDAYTGKGSGDPNNPNFHDQAKKDLFDRDKQINNLETTLPIGLIGGLGGKKLGEAGGGLWGPRAPVAETEAMAGGGAVPAFLDRIKAMGAADQASDQAAGGVITNRNDIQDAIDGLRQKGMPPPVEPVKPPVPDSGDIAKDVIKKISGPRRGGPPQAQRNAAASDMLDAYAGGTPSANLAVPDTYGFSPGVAGTVADRTRSGIEGLQKNGKPPDDIAAILKDLIARGLIKPAVAVGAGTATSLAPQQDDSNNAIAARLAPRLMGGN